MLFNCVWTPFINRQNNKDYKLETLRNEFVQAYKSYCGLSMVSDHRFNTELVSTLIDNLKHGKAPDIDGLSAELSIYITPIRQFHFS